MEEFKLQKQTIKVHFENLKTRRSKWRTWYDYDVNSTIQEVKSILLKHVTFPEPLSLMFDGFFLEDDATLAGLGVVDGDIIYVSDSGSESLDGVEMKRRIDDEFYVGSKVILGESVNGFDVIHEDKEKEKDSLSIAACCLTCIYCIREIYLFKEKFNQVLIKGQVNIQYFYLMPRILLSKTS